VLAHLGYTKDGRVTDAGKRLACLYTELDLLAAECLRRGLWDGLSPAELAACVSALTFESRTAEAAAAVPQPGGPVRDVLAATVSVWRELDDIEKDNRLSFLREPDPGFAWAAHAWAQGKATSSARSSSSWTCSARWRSRPGTRCGPPRWPPSTHWGTAW